MTAHRALAPLAAVALALAACSTTPIPTDSTATRDCSQPAACTTFGPPVLRYCPADEGACDGHLVRPEDVGGHLFAGVTATGRGEVTR